MSFVPFKKMKTDKGEAATQYEQDSEWTEAIAKRKSASTDTSPIILHTTHLLDINDDCLYEIFNLRRVSVMDLCSLAGTSTKLMEVATDIFVRRHKACYFREMALDDDGVMVKRVLTTFGSSILELHIHFTPYEIDAVNIMDSIIRNCTELKTLTMSTYTIPDINDEFTKIRKLFARLDALTIRNVWIEGAEKWSPNYCIVTPKGNLINLFRDCHSLVSLSIVDCFALERAIYETNFPKLQYMCEENIDNDYVVKNVRGFVYRHNNLKELTLGHSIHISGTIEIISENCTKLEKLELSTEAEPQGYETALRQLGKLQHLTELKIYWCNQNMVGLLTELQRSTSLKSLQLVSTLGSWDLIPTIAQIKSLRILKLHFINDLQNPNALRDLTQLVELSIINLNLREFDFDLVDIIQRLENLEKLQLYVRPRRCYISKNIYLQLVNIVENRPVAKSLYLELVCPTTKDFEHLLRPSVEL